MRASPRSPFLDAVAVAAVATVAVVAMAGLRPVWGETTAAPAPAGPRVVWLPGGYELVTRQVPAPAVLVDRYVPIYETWEEPIVECREVPKLVPRQVAVYDLRQVPVYETKRIPVVRDVSVPVFAYRSRPVMGPSWTCANEERLVPWWSVNEKVQSGVTTERKIVGYREERTQVGMRGERFQTGFRTEMVSCGTSQEQHVVGMRTVRRCVGWRTETVQVSPAGFKSVCERVERPGRWVTLSDTSVRPAPLAGTSATLTSAEYRAEYARSQRTGR